MSSRAVSGDTLGKSEFDRLCRLVYEHTGIVLTEKKSEMIYRRLYRRAKALKVKSIREYCEYLFNHEDDELPEFINSITTNLTSFFRENHHFEFLQNHYLKTRYVDSGQHGSTKEPLRVWSSACSTGEEPYSVAMTLLDFAERYSQRFSYSILATDIDSNVLATAEHGIYDLNRLNELPVSVKKKWFLRGKHENANKVRVRPQLQQDMIFQQLNLLKPWRVEQGIDVIFCRNVMIYFDKKTQAELIAKFYQILKPGGILFIGHSEGLPKEGHKFTCVGRTTFRK